MIIFEIKIGPYGNPCRAILLARQFIRGIVHMRIRAAIIIVLILLAGCGGRQREDTPVTYQEALKILEKRPDDAMANFEVWEEWFRRGSYDSLAADARMKMQEYPSARALNADAVVFIAKIHLMLDNLDSVKYYMDMAEKYEDDKAFSVKWHIMYHNVAGIYAAYANVDYPQALEHFKKALDYAEKTGDKYNQCIFLSNIVNLYTLRSDTLGTWYAKKAYMIAHELGIDYLKAFSAATLATMCYLKNDYALSMKYIDESLDLVEKNNNVSLLASTWNIKGDIYKGFGLDKEAMDCYRTAMEWFGQANSGTQIGLCYSYGNLLCERGLYEEAEEVFKKGIAVSYDKKNMEGRVKLLFGLSRVYDGLGEKEQALDWYKKYHMAQDSLVSEHREREFNQLLMKYEKQVYDSNLKEKDTYLAIAVMSVIIVGILSISLWVLYKRKDRMYRKLSQSYRDYMITRDKLRMENAASTIGRTEKTEGKADYDSLTGSGRIGLDSENESGRDFLPEKETDEKTAKEKELFCRIEDLMINKKLYRTSDISLEKICDLLDTNRVYVSKAINKYAKTSFYNYINSLRIDDAARILSDPKDDTPLKMLYADLGYNSASAFYRAFQKETGVPPSKFREQIRKIQNEEKEKIKSFS